MFDLRCPFLLCLFCAAIRQNSTQGLFESFESENFLQRPTYPRNVSCRFWGNFQIATRCLAGFIWGSKFQSKETASGWGLIVTAWKFQPRKRGNMETLMSKTLSFVLSLWWSWFQFAFCSLFHLLPNCMFTTFRIRLLQPSNLCFRAHCLAKKKKKKVQCTCCRGRRTVCQRTARRISLRSENVPGLKNELRTASPHANSVCCKDGFFGGNADFETTPLRPFETFQPHFPPSMRCRVPCAPYKLTHATRRRIEKKFNKNEIAWSRLKEERSSLGPSTPLTAPLVLWHWYTANSHFERKI